MQLRQTRRSPGEFTFMTQVAYNGAAARQDPAVRFGPAFIAAVSEVRPLLIGKYPDWRDIPRIMTSREAVDSRLASMSAGTKARVDFKRVFAKFAKQRLAGFEPAPASNGLFRYMTPVEDKLALTLDWHHKSGVGIGKLLELSIGLPATCRSAHPGGLLPFYLCP